MAADFIFPQVCDRSIAEPWPEGVASHFFARVGTASKFINPMEFYICKKKGVGACAPQNFAIKTIRLRYIVVNYIVQYLILWSMVFSLMIEI
jgi:hypothetical protein